jgi:hypothetical protein
MIFFDLEYYVPSADQHQSNGSLIFNPTTTGHKILGGFFISKPLLEDKCDEPKGFWIWDYKDDEGLLLYAITQYFITQWEKQREEKAEIMQKKIRDLVVCGFRVNIDLHALYIRSSLLKIKTSQRLYEIYLKTKSIDLANVVALLFPEDLTFYPKTFDETMKQLQLMISEKDPGRNVWQYYENKDFAKIVARTKQEVLDLVQVYQTIQKQQVKEG